MYVNHLGYFNYLHLIYKYLIINYNLKGCGTHYFNFTIKNKATAVHNAFTNNKLLIKCQ